MNIGFQKDTIFFLKFETKIVKNYANSVTIFPRRYYLNQ
jgi:hypothetical protein